MALKFSELLEYLSGTDQETTQKRSWNWFIQQARKTRTLAGALSESILTPTQAVKDKNTDKWPTGRFTTSRGPQGIIGKMILFKYDPKTKATLPYWDMFPLGFPIDILNDGYLMLNLHYLPPLYRAKLMDSLYNLTVNKNQMDARTRLNITYKVLKESSKYQGYKPCLKRYLYRQVQSQWTVIKPAEWDAAMMLPLQRFQKASINTVWNDSLKEIRK